MDFASDNTSGLAPRIRDALVRAEAGRMPAYGDDPLSRALDAAFSRLFETEARVFPVLTGTAANALALAQLAPPWGAVLCHGEAHVATDECGAPEAFTGGAKLVPLAGAHGKIEPEALAAALDRFPPGSTHHVVPAVLSLSQATEAGTLYRPQEIAALAAVARRRALRLHMDGARFANAAAGLAGVATPADLSWRAGIDVLSFGATKNGAMMAEAVIFFDPGLAASFALRRKRAGQLLSKSRFLAAQLLAGLEDGLWLDLAGHANAMARRLAAGLATLGLPPAHPVEANAVFAALPDPLAARARAGGARFYDWPTPELGPRGRRFVTSFATMPVEVDDLLDLLRKADTP